MNRLPKAKSQNIVVQNVSDEVLIYDLTTNKAYNLNHTAAIVFNACDGLMTFDQLKANSELTDEIIYLALDGLKKENLVKSNYVSPFAGMNRRQVIKKVGLASMVALPLISSLIAPSSAQASSQAGACASNVCTPARQNNCAGCTPGQTYTFTCYSGGGCTGPVTVSAFQYTCTANPSDAVEPNYSCRRT